MKKLRVYVTPLLVVLAIVTLVYNYLGGFSEIVVEEVNQTTFRIAGLEIDEDTKGSEIKTQFEELKSQTTEGKLKGSLLSMLSYERAGVSKRFIGALLLDGEEDIDPTYEVRELIHLHVFKVELKMHNAVMPLKENVQAEITTYALKQGIELDQTFLEIYNPDNSVTIYGFSSDN